MAQIRQADEIPGLPGDGPYSWHPEFLNDHLFWLSHLAAFFDDSAVDRLLLGPDYEAAWEYRDAINALPDWPLFMVPLEDGRRVYLCYCTMPDDIGITFYIHDPRNFRTVRATDAERGQDGYLYWPELLDLSDTDGRAARLLLLLPMLEFEDLPADAAAILSAALTELTAVDEPDELAATLLASGTQRLIQRRTALRS